MPLKRLRSYATRLLKSHVSLSSKNIVTELPLVLQGNFVTLRHTSIFGTFLLSFPSKVRNCMALVPHAPRAVVAAAVARQLWPVVEPIARAAYDYIREGVEPPGKRYRPSGWPGRSEPYGSNRTAVGRSPLSGLAYYASRYRTYRMRRRRFRFRRRYNRRYRYRSF